MEEGRLRWANSRAGDEMEELLRAWAAPHLGTGTLAVIWHGPAARGQDDPGAELDVHIVLSPGTFLQEWSGGRRHLREVFRGQMVRAVPATYDDMASWRWDPVLRFEFGTARPLYDADGRLGPFLRACVRVDVQQRRRETLECYAALREAWRGLGRHIRRGDAETVALLGVLTAESAMRLYFALEQPGVPARGWLLPEFRRLAEPAWREAAKPLLQPRGEPGEIRLAAARLVELARDRIHAAFSISRGALDSWGQDGTGAV